MKKRFNVLLALVRGKVIIIAQDERTENRADVMIGRSISKSFAVSSLVSTLKTLAL